MRPAQFGVTSLDAGCSATDAGSTARAWCQLAGVLAGLAALAALLPAPGTTARALLHQSGGIGTAGAQVAETAALAVATCTVWSLLGWIVLMSLVAVAGRSTGPLGTAARRLLLRIAPATARRVVLTVVGASMITGLSACGTGPAAAASLPVHGGQPASAGATAVAQVAGMLRASGMGPAVAPQVDVAGELRGRGGVAGWIAVEGSAFHSGSTVRPSGPAAGLRDAATADTGYSADAGSPGDAGSRGDAGSAGDAGSPGDLGDRSTVLRSLPSTDWPAAGPVPATAGSPIDIDWPAAPSTRSTPSASTPSARSKPSAPSTRSTPSAPSAASGEVVVLRGDSLWSIAAAHLPAGAGPAAVDASWRSWYQANKSVIGSDPDLLLPGQILRPPSGTSS